MCARTRVCVCAVYCMLSRSVVSNSATPWATDHQALLSMGVLQARTLEWVTISSSGDLPNSGIEPRSPALQTDSLPSEPPRKDSEKCVVLG